MDLAKTENPSSDFNDSSALFFNPATGEEFHLTDVTLIVMAEPTTLVIDVIGQFEAKSLRANVYKNLQNPPRFYIQKASSQPL